MSRGVFVLRPDPDGKLQLVPKHMAPPLHPKHGSGPMVISDTMDAIQSMVSGKMYDSKSEYYREVRQAGCEIVGNEKITPKERDPVPENIERDVAQAVQQVASK